MRWLSRMALPVNSARKLAATAICPGCRRSAWMRGSKGVSDPLAASVDSAPVTRAAWKTRSASNRPARAYAVENCVPFSKARPSLGASVTGCSPTLARPAAAGMTSSPSVTWPTPIIAADMWASGARSPDAPTDPCAGTTGRRSRSSMADSSCTVALAMPE